MSMRTTEAVLKALWRRPAWVPRGAILDFRSEDTGHMLHILEEDAWGITLMYWSDPDAGRDATRLYVREKITVDELRRCSMNDQKLVDLVRQKIVNCVRGIEGMLFNRKPAGWRWHRYYRPRRQAA